MKFLKARRKTMYLFHASGESFSLEIGDPESGQPLFQEVSSLRLPTAKEDRYDLRVSFGPLRAMERTALGKR
jgi:hypothetical protein